MSTGTNTARSPSRTSSTSKASKASRASKKSPRRPSIPGTPGSVSKRTQRKSEQKMRAMELFGGEPGDLFDGLVARVGGGIMDCTDALEVSAHEAGVSEPAAAAAVTAVLDTLRGDLAPRLVAFRAFALRNVFKLPPVSAENRLDAQLRTCALRLAKARANTLAIDAAQRTLQKRITRLEDAATALQLPVQLAHCEKENQKISKLAHDVAREVNDILPIHERQGILDITPDDETLKLPSKKSALPTISAVFHPHSDDDLSIGADDVHMDDKEGGGDEDAVMNALSILETCLPQKEK